MASCEDAEVCNISSVNRPFSVECEDATTNMWLKAKLHNLLMKLDIQSEDQHQTCAHSTHNRICSYLHTCVDLRRCG